MGAHIKNMFCFKHTFIYLACVILSFILYKYVILNKQLKSANIKLKTSGQTIEEDNSELVLTKLLVNLVTIAL